MDITRRSFLKKFGLTGASLAIPKVMTGCISPSMLYQEDSSTIEWPEDLDNTKPLEYPRGQRRWNGSLDSVVPAL